MNKKQVYTLPRTGQPPVRFEGRLVAKSDTEAMESLRHYVAEVYRMGEKWIAHVGYRTKWSGESDHDWVYVGYSVRDITKALKDYNVLPEGRGYPPMTEYEERQRKLRNFLQRDYDYCISEMLDNEEFVETLSDDGAEYGSMDLDALEAFVRKHLREANLSLKEICAICDANNGAMVMPQAWDGIIPNLQDSEGLDEKWGVSTEMLCKRLRDRSDSVMFALAFGVAYFWRRSDLPTNDALQQAGFVWED